VLAKTIGKTVSDKIQMYYPRVTAISGEKKKKKKRKKNQC